MFVITEQIEYFPVHCKYNPKQCKVNKSPTKSKRESIYCNVENRPEC